MCVVCIKWVCNVCSLFCMRWVVGWGGHGSLHWFLHVGLDRWVLIKFLPSGFINPSLVLAMPRPLSDHILLIPIRPLIQLGKTYRMVSDKLDPT